MKADIITIGDEILIGQVIDTNSTWIGQQLHQYGIRVNQIKSISDDGEDICNSITNSKADIVIITGGLGPTNDDITKLTLAKYFNSRLIFNEEVYANIERIFSSMGAPINKMNKNQALVPEKAEILPNKNGTAAGMLFNNNGQYVVSLPGVPFEMKSIISDYLLPKFSEIFKLKPIYFRNIMTIGIAESILAERLTEWEKALPPYIKLAYLPRPGIVRLRLSILGEDYHNNTEKIDQIVEELNQLLGQNIYSYKDCLIEDEVARLLINSKKTVSTAESCTGGNISARLTSISGSSSYYRGSVIAYSNEIKQSILDVEKEAIEQYGAVSESVVMQMAQNIREKMQTDFGIATSGIAGPNGGSEEKPVGTTWIAVASEDKVVTKCFTLGNHRGRNIEKACIHALNMLRLMMDNE